MRRFEYILILVTLCQAMNTGSGYAGVIVESNMICAAVSDTIAAVADRNELDIVSDVSYLADIHCDVDELPVITVETPNPSELAGRLRVTIVLAGSDGSVVRRLTLPAKIARFETVAVLARQVRRGTVLTSDMVTYERREITDPEACFNIGDVFIGKQAQRNLKMGDLLNRNYIATVPVIERGDKVTMRAQIGNVIVTAYGIAREDGGVDDKIRVYNSDTRTTITCTVIDSKTVRIDG